MSPQLWMCVAPIMMTSKNIIKTQVRHKQDMVTGGPLILQACYVLEDLEPSYTNPALAVQLSSCMNLVPSQPWSLRRRELWNGEVWNLFQRHGSG